MQRASAGTVRFLSDYSGFRHSADWAIPADTALKPELSNIDLRPDFDDDNRHIVVRPGFADE
jgi:hypothetical protein